MPTLNDQQVLEANIITALNLQGLPDDRKLALIQKVATLVQKAVQLRILKLLSVEDLQAFQQIIADAGEDSQAAVDFVKGKIPNLAALFEEELIAAKRNLIQQASSVSL